MEQIRKNYLWTQLKARLQLIKINHGSNWNWLFLPGGPGLGSESLAPLTSFLNLPGSMWHLDLPGDGSNLESNDFSFWDEALAQSVEALGHVILVGHSTGGMYALSTPALKESLLGLVLMDSAPDASWQQFFGNTVEQSPIPGMEDLHKEYIKSPSNELLKQLTLLSAPYLFTQEGLKKDYSFLETLPYNYQSCDWSAQHFDSTYEAKWFPDNLPTLIFAGEFDQITPLKLFRESPNFQADSIYIKEIPNAGHFPWVENPQAVAQVFEQYCQILSSK